MRTDIRSSHAQQHQRSARGIPPELEGNYCHITPESNEASGQKLWFANSPYGGSLLRFRGEPTSLLYAIAPLVDEIRQNRIPNITRQDMALLNPFSHSEIFYSELAHRLRSQKLRAICIGTMTSGSPEARRIARLVKENNPNTVTIFGGPHEDDIEVKTAADPAYSHLVDFSVSGDGEYALLSLIRILFENPDAGIEEIKEVVLGRKAEFTSCLGRGGVYFRHKDYARQLMLSQQMIPLETLPLMPRELLHESDTRTFSVFKDGGWNVKTAQVMTHRGCAWHCNFCSESAALNIRSVESVIKEIEEARHFSSRHSDSQREDYRAIFFDDSTFTTRAPRRIRFLNELFDYLETTGLEWGCQTRLDQIDTETLRAMRKAGCTYIYTGLESASNEMLRAMVKGETRSQIEKAFDALYDSGMRVGVSLIFGVAPTGLDMTLETDETIKETLDFVERQTQRGNIVVVSPNLATFYPGTRMSNGAGIVMDFQNPLVNQGYPWNRFEEGESFHPSGVTLSMAEDVLTESVRRFGEFVVDQDLYALEDYQFAWRSGLLSETEHMYINFNHASLAEPLGAARSAANAIVQMDKAELSRKAAGYYQEARRSAASLLGVNFERSENIVLARNATEAAAFSFWLGGLHRAGRGARVLTTNAENLSIPRGFRFAMDHGNTGGHDLWSSFQDFGSWNKTKPFLELRETGLDVQVIDVLSNLDCFEEKILDNLTPDTAMVVFSHVVRDTGRVCDAARLCAKIRHESPHALILIDGAQALGALPSVSVADLGCDFYVAAPHKTMGSYPLGILYVRDLRGANLVDLCFRDKSGAPLSVIMEGMFAPSLGLEQTFNEQLSLPEVAAFVETVAELERRHLISGNDCANLDRLRHRLKSIFLDRLTTTFPEAIVASPLGSDYSNFITSFCLPRRDNRVLVEGLWRENLVFASYVARTNVIRFAFGVENTCEEAIRGVAALQSVSAQMNHSPYRREALDEAREHARLMLS